MNIIFILIWIILTLSTGLISVWLGKKYGVTIPIAINASLLVLAGTTVTKIVNIGPYTTSAAVIVFSMTFLLTDLLSELWGKKYAQMAVWCGLYASAMFVLVTQITIAWPTAPFAIVQSEAFQTLFTAIPRITLAGWTAYVVSQNLDIYLFHLIRKITGEKHLWLRNNLSTIISQLVDTVVVAVLGFYGVFPLVPFILGTWLIKIGIALIDTPFVYAGKYLFKKLD